jgi:hypothetical protein
MVFFQGVHIEYAHVLGLIFFSLELGKDFYLFLGGYYKLY